MVKNLRKWPMPWARNHWYGKTRRRFGIYVPERRPVRGFLSLKKKTSPLCAWIFLKPKNRWTSTYTIDRWKRVRTVDENDSAGLRLITVDIDFARHTNTIRTKPRIAGVEEMSIRQSRSISSRLHLLCLSSRFYRIPVGISDRSRRHRRQMSTRKIRFSQKRPELKWIKKKKISLRLQRVISTPNGFGKLLDIRGDRCATEQGAI